MMLMMLRKKKKTAAVALIKWIYSSVPVLARQDNSFLLNSFIAILTRNVVSCLHWSEGTEQMPRASLKIAICTLSINLWPHLQVIPNSVFSIVFPQMHSTFGGVLFYNFYWVTPAETDNQEFPGLDLTSAIDSWSGLGHYLFTAPTTIWRWLLTCFPGCY